MEVKDRVAEIAQRHKQDEFISIEDRLWFALNNEGQRINGAYIDALNECYVEEPVVMPATELREILVQVEGMRAEAKRYLEFDGGPELLPWEATHTNFHKTEPYVGCPFCHSKFVRVEAFERARTALEEILANHPSSTEGWGRGNVLAGIARAALDDVEEMVS